MPASPPRSSRRKPQRPARKAPVPPVVPEQSSGPAPAPSAPEKETPLEESIRKMLEAAYT